MNRTLVFVWITPLLTLSALASAARSEDQAASLTGRWVLTADFYGTVRYLRLQLQQQDLRLTGSWNGSDLEGSVDGAQLHFTVKTGQGSAIEVDGSVERGTMTGTVVQRDLEDPPISFHFSGTLVPELRPSTPQRHEFTPSVFYRQFSPFNKPVLMVAPGDTVHTTTVDAGGNDEKGIKRVAAGNPQTVPLYIECASPGD